jgi:integrase
MPRRNRGAYLSWRSERRTWVIIWYEKGRRRISGTGTSDRREADQRLVEFLLARPQSGPRIGPVEPQLRNIADVLQKYAEEHGGELAGLGAQTLGYNLKALIPFWGTLTVGDVREATCRAYVRHRGALSSATAARELSVLGAAINHDWRAGRLKVPVPIWKPAPSPPKDLWLRREDVARLLRATRSVVARRHLSTFVMLGIYTAGRAEALLSLRWTQVSFELGRLDLNQPGRARTRKGRPVLPIPRHLLLHLRQIRRRGNDLGYVITYANRPIKSIKKGFRQCCEAAALRCEARAMLSTVSTEERTALLASAARLRAATPHTLRHTSATWMARAGVPFPVIAAYLGHSTSWITEHVYAHHSPDYLFPATAAFDRITRA